VSAQRAAPFGRDDDAVIEILAQVKGWTAKGPFAAGIVLWETSDGEFEVVETAPILRRMRGWTRQQTRSYIGKQGHGAQRWTVSVVHQIERERPPWWKTEPTKIAPAK
jgi:hypothetical protein